MNSLLLRGGSVVGPGVYREVRSGHLVHLGTEGYLPGQINSERYVQVPDRLYLQQQMQELRRRRPSA